MNILECKMQSPYLMYLILSKPTKKVTGSLTM